MKDSTQAPNGQPVFKSPGKTFGVRPGKFEKIRFSMDLENHEPHKTRLSNIKIWDTPGAKALDLIKHIFDQPTTDFEIDDYTIPGSCFIKSENRPVPIFLLANQTEKEGVITCQDRQIQSIEFK